MRSPGPRPRFFWRRMAGFVVAAVCLWLAFRGVDRAELVRVLRGASPGRLLAAGAVSILANAVKCLKIGVLLRHVRRLRFRILFAAEMISILVDILFPLRLQELVRAYVIGRHERMAAGFVLGAELVEKCVESVCLLAILWALSVVHPLPGWLALWIRIAGAVAFLFAAGLTLTVVRPDWNDWAVRRIERIRLPGMTRLCRILEHILRGVREASVRPRALLAVLGITAVEWHLLALALWLAARAVGVTLTPAQVLGALAFNMIAFAVPASSTGSIGIYELAGTATWVLVFGFAREQALAVTLAQHIVMAGAGVLGGLAGLQMTRLTLRQVRREAQRVSVTPRSP